MALRGTSTLIRLILRYTAVVPVTFILHIRVRGISHVELYAAMSVTKRHLTLDVLNFYYAEVHNLQAYLQKIVKEESFKQTCGDGQSDFPLQAPDSVQFRELLTCSFVCLSKESTTERTQFSASEPYIDMKEVCASMYPNHSARTQYITCSEGHSEGPGTSIWGIKFKVQARQYHNIGI